MTIARHVGVVGLTNAGKTVLLTSLINHLTDHEPDRFRLGHPPATVRKFRPEPATPGWEPFAYHANRDALVERGRWPAKTRDRSEYACRFDRSDWRFNSCVLRLFDFPAERFADAAMMARTYAEWSDHWFAAPSLSRAGSHSYEGYLAALDSPSATPESLLAAYRLALAATISPPHYRPYVTPSTFLLDQAGRPAPNVGPSEMATVRVSGLSPESQFSPLPRRVREQSPVMSLQFMTGYDVYRSAVVAPYFSALRGCHSLVVVVDVLHLLAAGVGAANDSRQILGELFAALKPGEPLYLRLLRNAAELAVEGALPAISRIAFVVPKIDLVHPDDRDVLLHLLKTHVGKFAKDYDDLTVDYFAIASVNSTRPLALSDPERQLVGVLVPRRRRQAPAAGAGAPLRRRPPPGRLAGGVARRRFCVPRGLPQRAGAALAAARAIGARPAVDVPAAVTSRRVLRSAGRATTGRGPFRRGRRATN